MHAKSDPRELVKRLALIALALCALVTGLPSVARGQEVFCDPGEKEVFAVRFVGNATFSSDELSAIVISTPSSLLRRSLARVRINKGGARRCFPDIGLANDVANLKAYYENNGFYDTRVDTAVARAGTNKVTITFRITEGQPVILDSLSITGLDSVPERAEVLKDSLIKVGQPVGKVQVIGEVDSITSRLRNSGYPRADVFRSFSVHPATHRAEADLDVQPGPRARIGRITVQSQGVSGDSAHVDPAVVLGVTGIRTGDTYSDRALAVARRNLYDLGVFLHADVSVDTTWAHGDSVADIVIGLREDFLHQLDTDYGWGTLDCFKVNAVYTDKNVMKQARRVDWTARVSKLGYGEPVRSGWTRNLCYRPSLDNDSIASSKVNDYLGATLTFPTLFGRRVTPSFSGYTERRGQYQAYLRTTDIGGTVAFTSALAAATSIRYGYSAEHGVTQAEPVVLCALFSRCSEAEQAELQQRLLLGVASVLLTRSTTDDPFAPTHGYIASFETRYSGGPTLSDPSLSFFKATGDVAWYRRVMPRLTFAARARGGIIRGGEQIGGSSLPPPQERLYAGGNTTVRGFAQNQLGPQVYLLTADAFEKVPVTDSTFYYRSRPDKGADRSIPGGGSQLAVFNAELRFRYPRAFEFIPFVDAGQVWISQIEKNVSRQRLAVTPGLSVRYFSPFGPAQVNVGYNSYPPQPGAAYFLGTDVPNRPLLCVTAPGVTPVLIKQRGNELIQDAAACPASYVPAKKTSFWSRLTLTVTIGGDF